MSNAVVGKLIGKELSLNRPLMIGATVAGLVALGIVLFGRVLGGAGGIMFLTVVIAYSVILPAFSIQAERKGRSLLFALSLPISRSEYVWAKIAGLSLTYLVTWTVLLLAALAVILGTRVPDGMVVFTVLIMMFALADFCVIVCGATLLAGDVTMTILIIVTNMCVTFFIVGMSNLTPIGREGALDAVHWSPTALAILGSELAVVGMCFVVLFVVLKRKPEIV